MCQTYLISNSIVNLSTRSFKQWVKASAPEGFNLNMLARLNRDLDIFYELLYSQWTTITEEDYKVFGNQLCIMINTIKELLDTSKNFSFLPGFEIQFEKLKRNYSALFELNHDIVNFKIKIPKDPAIKNLMDRASKVAKKISAQ